MAFRKFEKMEKEEKMTPLKAIKLHCKECMGFESNPKECNIQTCHLFQFRLGKDMLKEKREISEEQRLKMKENLRRAREIRNQKFGE